MKRSTQTEIIWLDPRTLSTGSFLFVIRNSFHLWINLMFDNAENKYVEQNVSVAALSGLEKPSLSIRPPKHCGWSDWRAFEYRCCHFGILFFFFAFAVQLKVQYVVFKVFCYLRMSLSYLQREQVLLHGAAKIHSYASTVAQNGQTEHWF